MMGLTEGWSLPEINILTTRVPFPLYLVIRIAVDLPLCFQVIFL